MSHGDTITSLPNDSKLIASTDSVVNAAYGRFKTIYAFNFTLKLLILKRASIIKRFVIEIVLKRSSWNMPNYVETAVKNIKKL